MSAPSRAALRLALPPAIEATPPIPPAEPELAPEGAPTTTRPKPPVIPGVTVASAIGVLFRLQDIAAWLGVDEKTVKRMLARGRFPKPDLIVGRRSPRWRQATLDAWFSRSQPK